MNKRFNILSLSGGGARGIFTVRALVEIEKRFGKPVMDSVDMVCGTSIGGILALGLASDIPAAKMLSVFDENRLKIFPQPTKKDIKKIKIPYTSFEFSRRDIQQAKHALFDPKPLKNVLTELFEDRQIKDLNHCALIPAINYSTGTLRAFKTPHHPNFYQDKEQSLVDVGLATSAAPTYFPNHEIDSARYVDGGVVVNNPVLMGVVEAKSAFSIDMKDMYALCIGNMGKERSSDHEKPVNLGYIGWEFGKGIIDLSMSIGEKIHYDMARILLAGRISEIDKVPTEAQAHLMSLDNASNAAAEILKSQAEQISGQRVNDDDIKNYFNHVKTTNFKSV